MKKKGPAFYYALTAGALTAALGLAVMAAWYGKIPFIFQVSSQFIPMQFNTALCFALFGVGLLVGKTGPAGRRISMMLSLGIGIMAGLNCLQYVLSANLGIDSFFVDPYVSIKNSNPGRMSPITAFCLMLLSVSLFCRHALRRNSTRLMMIMMTDPVVLFLSATTLSGYIFDIESAYSWWGISNISPLTAIGLFLASTGLLAVAIDKGFLRKQEYHFWWQPALTVSLGITLTFLLAQGIQLNLRNEIQKVVAIGLKRTILNLGAEIEADVGALSRMQARILNGHITPDILLNDMNNYIHENPAYLSMAFVNSQLQIVKMTPASDRSQWESLISDQHHKVLSLARRSQDVFLLKPSRNHDSSRMLMVFPILENRGRPSFLLVSYDFRKKAEAIAALQTDSQSYLEITGEDGVTHTSAGKADYPWSVEQTDVFTFLGHQWQVRQVTNAAGYDSGLVVLVIISGLGLSFLLAYLLWQSAKVHYFSYSHKQSEARLESILDNIADGLVTIDERGIIQSYNKACEKIFGYKAHEIVGSNISLLMPEPDARQHDGYIGNFRATGHARIIGIGRVLEGRHKNGTVIPLDLSVTEFRVGNRLFFSGIVRDITERKRAEEALMRSNEELEKFAYVASHDLKAPLRNIDDLALWVIEDTDGILPKDARSKLDLLRNRISRLEMLLDDILAYSRAGRLSGNSVTIDANELVGQIAQTHVPDSFTVSIKGALPTLISPRTPLEQIVGNLLSNAVKHHDKDHGAIEIEAREKDNFIEFIVRDDGPGIAPEFHEKVFQMFQTLKSRDKVSGSGLGMAIIKKLVEWQGGRVWIESPQKDGRGTAVHFLWPRAVTAK